MHITYIYLVIIQNKGYALGLALGRQIVSYVSRRWLRDLLLVLLDHFLILLLPDGLELHQRILYMHAMMMQHNILATAVLKLTIHLPSY